jgi:hypothetical protein
MEHLVGHTAVEDCSINYVDGDFEPLGAVAANVASCIDELPEVDLVVFDSDESHEMRPGRHCGIKTPGVSGRGSWR